MNQVENVVCDCVKSRKMRWSSKNKRQACVSLSHFIVRSYFSGDQSERKKVSNGMLRTALRLLRPFFWGHIVPKKSLLALMNSICEKSHRTLSMYGGKSCIKKPSLHTSLKQAKGKLLLTSTYILIVKWLAVIIPTISTYYMSYIKYTITVFKRRNHSDNQEILQTPPHSTKNEAVKHTRSLSQILNLSF